MKRFVVKPIVFIGASLCFSLLAACGSDNGDENHGFDENQQTFACADVIVFFDPLVQINSVTDASTGEDLTQVTMRELTIDGESRPFDQLDSDVLSRVDIVEGGDAAICTVPCALFTQEGDYSMVVSATAFEPKRLEFSPQFDDFGSPEPGDCPGFFGSYELNLSLDPAF